jgi:ribosome-associated protein
MIRVTRRIALDEGEVRFAFVRSSGPGGQNVNKVATAVQLRFDVRRSPSLPEDVRERLIRLAGRRVTGEGVLVLEARRFRTQERNRRDALERLLQWIRRAAQPPKVRRPTRPPAASREQRREEKRRRSETKRLRAPLRLGVALWLALAALGATGASRALAPPAGNRPGLSLAETCEIYLRSAQDGDLAALLSVPSDSSDFRFLAPTGESLDREGFRRFHAAWFGADEWSLSAEILSLQEGVEGGHAIAWLDYARRTPEGDAQHFETYLTVVFRREDGMWRAATLAGTPVRRYVVAAASGLAYGSDTLRVLGMIGERRTVRGFRPDPVPDEHLARILEAAGKAPVDGVPPAWTLRVVRDRDALDRLARQAVRRELDVRREQGVARDEEIDSLRAQLASRAAPLCVAVLADTTQAARTEAAMAASRLMLAARALGYGAGLLGPLFPEAVVREAFELPERDRVVGVVAIGVAD